MKIKFQKLIPSKKTFIVIILSLIFLVVFFLLFYLRASHLNKICYQQTILKLMETEQGTEQTDVSDTEAMALKNAFIRLNHDECLQNQKFFFLF